MTSLTSVVLQTRIQHVGKVEINMMKDIYTCSQIPESRLIQKTLVATVTDVSQRRTSHARALMALVCVQVVAPSRTVNLTLSVFVE